MCPYGVLGVRGVLETVFTHKKISKTRQFDDDPYYPHDFKYRNAPAKCKSRGWKDSKPTEPSLNVPIRCPRCKKCFGNGIYTQKNPQNTKI